MFEGPPGVLLVEDNDGDAFLVEHELRGTGQSGVVERVSRLDEGIELGRTQQPDVMLLDLSLPDSRGLDTVTRAVEALPSTPIVVLTGTDDQWLAERSLQAGAQDYLVKGRFDADGLVRAIRYAVERHRVMRMLREANEELALANEVKDDFVAIASHELRTPVSVINATVQTLLARSTGLAEDQREQMLAAVGRQSERLAELVEDLLVLARLDRAAIEARSRSLDLRSVVVAAVDASRIPAADVRVEVPSQAVVTDDEYLTRILVNLLDNADKYGEPPVEVRSTVEEACVTLHVRDHGPGIDPEIEPRLFQRFVRSADPEVRRQPGTGLGLAIVAALAGTLGVSVGHARAVGGGARFDLRLPTGRCEGAASTSAPVRKQQESTR